MAAPTYTHAFDFYYKAVPTASLAIVDSNWYIRTYYDELESNIEFTRAWYNLCLTMGQQRGQAYLLD